MSRTAAALLFVLAGPLAAADLRPDALEVGQVGRWRADTGGDFEWRVAEVIDARRMVLVLPGLPDSPVLVRGRPTAGIADGKRLTLAGEWRVAGTEKYSGRTYYVVEPAEAKK
jgi:hypothetical protein